MREAGSILDEMISKCYEPRCANIHLFVDQLCEKGNRKVLRTVLNTPLKGNVIEFDTWKVLIPQTCKDDKRSKALQLVDNLIRH